MDKPKESRGKAPHEPKIYVFDTNIILHDYKAIKKFQDNDIVIPMAVIEELDKFKKGKDALSFNARGFMRELDLLTYGKMFGKDGVPLGKNLGRIKIEPNHPFPDKLKDLFIDDIQDHRILATAIWVRDNHPGRFTALVTKDINLRMKAKAAGMEAQDYLTDKIDDERIESVQRKTPPKPWPPSPRAPRMPSPGKPCARRNPFPTSFSSYASRGRTMSSAPAMTPNATPSYWYGRRKPTA